MLATVVSLLPFAPSESPRIFELGAGDGRLSAALLDCFPKATLTALEGSESMRAAASRRLERFGERSRVATFDLAALDWWDRLRSADVVVSSLAVHHLNDAKKQYLYKAIADRISDRGALIVADRVASRWNHEGLPDGADQPGALFHHLVWLKHAGFAAVDCWWLFGGHAVFGAFKQAGWSGVGVGYADALSCVRRALQS